MSAAREVAGGVGGEVGGAEGELRGYRGGDGVV